MSTQNSVMDMSESLKSVPYCWIFQIFSDFVIENIRVVNILRHKFVCRRDSFLRTSSQSCMSLRSSEKKASSATNMPGLSGHLPHMTPLDHNPESQELSGLPKTIRTKVKMLLSLFTSVKKQQTSPGFILSLIPTLCSKSLNLFHICPSSNEIKKLKSQLSTMPFGNLSSVMSHKC